MNTKFVRCTAPLGATISRVIRPSEAMIWIVEPSIEISIRPNRASRDFAALACSALGVDGSTCAAAEYAPVATLTNKIADHAAAAAHFIETSSFTGAVVTARLTSGHNPGSHTERGSNTDRNESARPLRRTTCARRTACSSTASKDRPAKN